MAPAGWRKRSGPHGRGASSGSELDRLALLAAVFGGSTDPRVALGIGDDAAVLAAGDEPLVWSIDVLVEQVHFRREWLSLHDLGYRASMAAASDLAAMAARARGMLASLVLPEAMTDAELEQIAKGQAEACRELDTQLIGGNLSRGQALSITTTVLGSAPRPIGRAGARPGHAVWLAGPVGLAAAGLEHLRGATAGGEVSSALAAAVAAWRRPRARIAEGLRVAPLASAAIDVSDGLALDLARLTWATPPDSNAVPIQFVLDRDAIVGESLRQAAVGLGRSATDLALSGGEDYALLVVMPDGDPPKGFVRIGRCIDAVGEDDSPVKLRDADGALRPVQIVGYDHFR